MLMTNDQIDELVSALADWSGLDDELVERSGSLVRDQRYDEAVTQAFIVLEERMRALMGMRGGAGRDLVNRLFSQKNEYVERLNLPEKEWKGICSLFEGAFAAYRNRAAHTFAGYTRDEARAIIQLVNLLLLIVEQMRSAPERQVPREVEAALGPHAAERLQRFLTRLVAIGFVREKGTSRDAYKARLPYRSPDWPQYKPHFVTVFYLKRGSNPSLRFRIDMLSNVKDLDIVGLHARLLEAGCQRSSRKSTPIELVLSQHNDQDTLDRLYDILRELAQRKPD